MKVEPTINPVEVANDAIVHLRAGHTQMAHIELMTALETLPLASEWYIPFQMAADSIDSGEPRTARETLERILNKSR